MSSAAAPRTVAIAADHGGFALKEQLKEYLATKHAADVRVVDVGCFSADRVDYPGGSATSAVLVVAIVSIAPLQCCSLRHDIK